MFSAHLKHHSSASRSLFGISQVAPRVAGCAAVLRQALQRNGQQSPSGAIFKSLLVNDTDDFVGTKWLFREAFGAWKTGTSWRLSQNWNASRTQPCSRIWQGKPWAFLSCILGRAQKRGDVYVSHFPPQGEAVEQKVNVPTNARNLRLTLA